METILIRAAGPGDDARVGELLVNAYLSTYAKKMPEVFVPERRRADLRDVARQRTLGTVLVAEMEGKIVATVTLARPGDPESHAWTPNTGEIRRMAVEPAFHGRGISRALLGDCVRLAREWKLSALALHVRRGAKGIARMYQANGYVRHPEGDCDLLPEIFLEAYLMEL